MSSHWDVSCDGCDCAHLVHYRYKCLRCPDFDLCKDCHENGVATGDHRRDHPFQCLLDREAMELHFAGEPMPGLCADSFTCPVCGQLGLSSSELVDHVNELHRLDRTTVICPLCVAQPDGHPDRLDNLAGHLALMHSATAQNSSPAVEDPPRLVRTAAGGGEGGSVLGSAGDGVVNGGVRFVAGRGIPFGSGGGGGGLGSGEGGGGGLLFAALGGSASSPLGAPGAGGGFRLGSGEGFGAGRGGGGGSGGFSLGAAGGGGPSGGVGGFSLGAGEGPSGGVRGFGYESEDSEGFPLDGVGGGGNLLLGDVVGGSGGVGGEGLFFGGGAATGVGGGVGGGGGVGESGGGFTLGGAGGGGNLFFADVVGGAGGGGGEGLLFGGGGGGVFFGGGGGGLPFGSGGGGGGGGGGENNNVRGAAESGGRRSTGLVLRMGGPAGTGIGPSGLVTLLGPSPNGSPIHAHPFEGFHWSTGIDHPPHGSNAPGWRGEEMPPFVVLAGGGGGEGGGGGVGGGTINGGAGNRQTLPTRGRVPPPYPNQHPEGSVTLYLSRPAPLGSDQNLPMADEEPAADENSSQLRHRTAPVAQVPHVRFVLPRSAPLAFSEDLSDSDGPDA